MNGRYARIAASRGSRACLWFGVGLLMGRVAQTGCGASRAGRVSARRAARGRRCSQGQQFTAAPAAE
jgi:hypothetical protein